MRTFLVCFCLCFLGKFPLNAQLNYYTFGDPHLANQASENLPSLLGDHTKTGEFYPVTLYTGFTNNFIRASDLSAFSAQTEISREDMDAYLGKLKPVNQFWAGYNAPLFQFFFNVPKKRKPFISFGFGAGHRTDFNFDVNREFLELLIRGNKNMAGQTVPLAPQLNLLSYNQLFLTASTVFRIIPWKNAQVVTIKPAVRVRYLSGLACVRMPSPTLNMYTDPEGRYLDFDTDLRINMSSIADTPTLNDFASQGEFNLNSPGKGWGFDLGAGITVLRNLQLHAALNDLGGITFNRNVINYSKQGTVRYDGVDLDKLNSGSDSLLNFTKLEEIIQPEKTYESFRSPLGARLILSGMYGLQARKRRRIPYFVHNLSFTYVQGLRDYLNTTTKPIAHAAYTYSFKNILNLGTGVTLGGISGFMAGAHLSLKANWFKLGIASNNLLPLISTRAGRGTDLHAFIGFSF